MKRIIGILCMTGLGGCASNAAPPQEPSKMPTQPDITYERVERSSSQIHILRIPASRFAVTPAVANSVATVETFGKGAIAALNAGFFDPVNQQTTSYVMLNGKTVADPNHNQRLIGNPDLADYLDKILDRSEFRQYRCGATGAATSGATVRYAIVPHHALPPAGCQLAAAMGGGPQLLPEYTARSEGFVDAAAGRDAIGTQQPNARSAVGITSSGDIVLVMVAQTKAGTGLSLPELADFLQTIGVEHALNLDGGSSASLSYKDQPIYGKVDAEGNRVRRAVKSVLLVTEANSPAPP